MNINPNNNECPLLNTINSISGKWKVVILYTLYQKKIARYTELKKAIPNITHKVLSCHLKELLEMEIIHRKDFPTIPPKVEYSLSEKGKGLLRVLKDLYHWGEENLLV